NAAGQAAAYDLAPPLAAGRAGVSFYDAAGDRAARWVVGFTFQRAALHVVIAGADDYAVEGWATTGQAFRTRRGVGWHRLVAEFGPESVLVTVDDNVLWSGAPAGALRTVRLACVAARGRESTQGAVWFDEFRLGRAVEDLRHRRA